MTTPRLMLVSPVLGATSTIADPFAAAIAAAEFAAVVKGLWESWEDDAFPRDRDSGLFADPSKLHILGHKGAHLSVAGPLNVPRSPQGHPVVVQAGSSEPGRELAAATAEVVFTAHQTLAPAADFYADVKGRMARHGRRPETQAARLEEVDDPLEMVELFARELREGADEAEVARVPDHERERVRGGLHLAVGMVDQDRIQVLHGARRPGRIRGSAKAEHPCLG